MTRLIADKNFSDSELWFVYIYRKNRRRGTRVSEVKALILNFVLIEREFVARKRIKRMKKKRDYYIIFLYKKEKILCALNKRRFFE